MLIGYARVSTIEQETRLQLDALKAAGVSRIFAEKTSAIGPRPELQRALAALRPGSVLVVYRLDRLARSLKDLLHLLDTLKAAGCAVKSLTEPIDTSSAMGEFILQVLGAVAQLERAIIRERCAAGRVAAKARGQVWGRPRVLSVEDEIGVVSCYRSGWFTVELLAAMLGVGRGAVRGPLCRAGLLSRRYLG